VTGLVIIFVILWLFWPSKSPWHPFGGIYKRDRKTGAITMALTLPIRKKRR
jgi:hypothetical protein